MDAKYPEITLGESVCEKIRTIYFNGSHWTDCHKEVAKLYNQIKNSARSFYTDKSEYEILVELNRYSFEDIKDALGNVPQGTSNHEKNS